MWDGIECAKTRTSRQPSPMQIIICLTQPESVENFEYFGCITNYVREIKSSIVIAKAAFNKKIFFSTNLA